MMLVHNNLERSWGKGEKLHGEEKPKKVWVPSIFPPLFLYLVKSIHRGDRWNDQGEVEKKKSWGSGCFPQCGVYLN